MTNHQHLIAIPPTEETILGLLITATLRHAPYQNTQKGEKGRRWRGRFFSGVMDETPMRRAMRSVDWHRILTEHPQGWAGKDGKQNRARAKKGADPFFAPLHSVFNYFVLHPKDIGAFSQGMSFVAISISTNPSRRIRRMM